MGQGPASEMVPSGVVAVSVQILYTSNNENILNHPLRALCSSYRSCITSHNHLGFEYCLSFLGYSSHHLDLSSCYLASYRGYGHYL